MSKQGKKILFIEDDPAIGDIYKIIFEKNNFIVEILTSGKEAVEKIEAMTKNDHLIKPDIIFLDLVLPDLNGIEILKKIRNNQKIKDMPVFILTNQEKEQLPAFDEYKPDKVIIKANTAPTQLVDLVKEQLK